MAKKGSKLYIVYNITKQKGMTKPVLGSTAHATMIKLQELYKDYVYELRETK